MGHGPVDGVFDLRKGFRIVDLSHPLDEAIPIYPGDPPFRSERAVRLEEMGYNVHRICMGSHAGTHIDAPAHFVAGGATVDALPPEAFVLVGTVLDLRGKGPREAVTAADLEPFAQRLEGVQFPLLYFGWDRHWRDPERMQAHPFLSGEAARWLADRGVRGVGTDGMSVDETGGEACPAHEELMGRGLLIAENLANLGSIRTERPLLFLLPLPLVGSDASPVRAVALEPAIDPPDGGLL